MDRWRDRLSELIDGELEGAELRELEAHLAGCEDCRRELDSLRRIVQRLAEAPDREPDRDLWPGIAPHVGATEGAHAAAGGPPGGRGSRRTMSLILRVAATVGGVGLLVLALWQRQAGEPGSGAEAIAPAPVATRYEQAAVAWREVLAARDLPPEIAGILESEMAALDRAVAETREAIAMNPGDQDLQAHLAATLRARVRFLARVDELAREAS